MWATALRWVHPVSILEISVVMFFIKENYSHPSFKLGIKDISSAAPGIAAWGMMIGVAMIQSGMSVFDSVLQRGPTTGTQPAGIRVGVDRVAA